MYNEFLESIIIKINPKLSKEDLNVLYKISKEYEIPMNALMSKSLDEIVEIIVCYNVPYFVGKQFVCNDEIDADLVNSDNGYFYCCANNINGQEYVNFHIQKINRLINES